MCTWQIKKVFDAMKIMAIVDIIDDMPDEKKDDETQHIGREEERCI